MRHAALVTVFAGLTACGGTGAEIADDPVVPDASVPTAPAQGVADAGSAPDGTAFDAGTAPALDATTADDAAPSPGSLPYLVGIKCNGHESAPGTLAGWLARPTDLAGTTINTDGYLGATSEAYRNADGSLPLLEVSFPLLSLYGEESNLTDMGQAASGAYDAQYAIMARALAAFPNPLLSVRIGWELNGNWYAWSSGVGPGATYAHFVSAFQRAATIVRMYNPHVLVQWNLAWGQPDPTPYWPGTYDAQANPGGVDVVSLDFYQANISEYNNGGKPSSWAMAQSGTTVDVDWMVAFARKNEVKVALSEYGAGEPSSNGLGSGPGLDDGAWTAASIAWMNAQPAGFFLWTSWSDDEPADDIVTPGANPQEQAAWSAAWKGTHFGGSWWQGTPPPSAHP